MTGKQTRPNKTNSKRPSMTNLCRDLTDLEYAQCFDQFKTISTEWDAISNWLKYECIPDLKFEEKIDILSIGSGRGDFDLALIGLLNDKYSRIVYTAVDPNTEHNRIFQDKVQLSGTALDSFHIIPEPFQEDTVRGTYDLIHLTHCLYYIPERKKAIKLAYDMLKPNGSLLIFHQTALGVNEVQRLFMQQVKGDRKEMFSANELLGILDSLHLPFKSDILISDLDVTDIVNGNAKGRHLLEFFLEANLDGVDEPLLSEIVRYVIENCRISDGRYYFFHPSSIFWVKKPLGENVPDFD